MTIKTYNPITFGQINDLLESILASDRETLRSLIADCEDFSGCDDPSDLDYPLTLPPARKQHVRNKAILWRRFRGFLFTCRTHQLHKQEKKDGS